MWGVGCGVWVCVCISVEGSSLNEEAKCQQLHYPGMLMLASVPFQNPAIEKMADQEPSSQLPRTLSSPHVQLLRMEKINTSLYQI